MARQMNLMLHCGAHAADREQIEQVITPPGTDTWYPIPHKALIGQVERKLPEYGLTVVREQHALMRDEHRYFGLYQIADDNASDDHCFVIGLRNSHDKSFPAGLVVGNGVFVCDNLSFSGEIKIGRRHTRNIMDDLPRLIAAALGKLVESRIDQETRFNAYKQRDISDDCVRKLITDAYENKALAKTKAMDLWDEWKEPKHSEFKDRTAWSFHNCFTEICKAIKSPFELANRTQRIHPMLDSLCGITIGQNLDDVEDAEFEVRGQLAI